MNSYQHLDKEMDEAIAANDLPKIKDVLRRVKNLTVSPTCKGYPWPLIVEKATPLLTAEERDITVAGIMKMRQEESDRVMAEEIRKGTLDTDEDLELFSKGFMQSFANANTGKKRRHV